MASQPTPGPWHVEDGFGGIIVVDANHRHVCEIKSALEHQQADAQVIAAAPDLLAAAKLTELHFKRNQASDTFQGDDEHEAWSALLKAITKAEVK